LVEHRIFAGDNGAIEANEAIEAFLNDSDNSFNNLSVDGKYEL